MLGKVVAARIALKELEAQCRLECRYPTTDGCMVGPSAASGQRDGTRPGNGEEEAEVVPVEGRRGHMCNSTQNWREIPDFCEDSLMLRSFLKPKNQQDDEGWFSCRRSSYRARCASAPARWMSRSEEHTSELQSLMRISYAVFCLKKKKTKSNHNTSNTQNK